jgi:hypothetical protein
VHEYRIQQLSTTRVLPDLDGPANTIISPGFQWLHEAGRCRVLDQGCNVMIDQSMTIDETTPVSEDAKTLAAAGRLATSAGTMQDDQQPNGATKTITVTPGEVRRIP